MSSQVGPVLGLFLAFCWLTGWPCMACQGGQLLGFWVFDGAAGWMGSQMGIEVDLGGLEGGFV